MDVEETLTTKAGPFPVWLWGVALGGIVVAVIWMRGRTDYTPTITGTAGSGSRSDVADGYDYSTTDNLSGIDSAIQYDGDNSGDVKQPTPVPPNAEPSITTNAAWLAQGVTYLITQGHTPLGSQTALTRYLNGMKLTQSQASAVSKAITRFGLPPQGAPTATIEPPAPTPGTVQTVRTKVPRQAYYVKGKSDDTFKELAIMFYGSTPGAWTKLQIANPTKNSPFKKGTRIVIPAGTKTTTKTVAARQSSDTIAARAAVVPSVVIQSAAPGTVEPRPGETAASRSASASGVNTAPYVDRLS